MHYNRNGFPVEVRTYRKEPTFWDKARFYVCAVLIATLIILAIFLTSCSKGDLAYGAEVWKLTAYCPCVKCCGKSDGITASGRKARYGYVAGNWLAFGTKVKIEGLGIFEVQDRGARSHFGSKNDHKKRLDIFFPTHQEALRFGVQYKEVEVLNV